LTQVVVAAGALSFSLPALADEARKNCPPGAWFCAEADVSVNPQLPQVAPQQPAQPVQPVQPAPVRPRVAPPPAEVLDEPEAPPAAPPVRRPRPAQPPIVVYQQVPSAPPPQVIIVTPGTYGYGYGRYARPAPPPPPAPRMARPVAKWHPEFGLNLRVEGAPLGRSPQGFNAGLGGIGASLRYRPVPAFAFDIGADVLMGTDYNGFNRTEIPVSLSGMLFLNPRSRVQVYLTAGGHVSRAQVRSDIPATRQLDPVEDGTQYGATYTYLGGQAGGGFEFRLSKRIALDLDCVGYIRKRVDDGQKPEFFDPSTGRTTNVSGGPLFRGGINFWW
jgi:hypothetical protein